jgi:hypothetical protein
MKRVTPEYYNTPEEIKKFEVLSPKCSKIYAPIYSSDIVKILEPEYKMTTACKWYKNSTKHYVDLENGNDKIRIYNSYDRTLSFRMGLVSDGFSVDLGAHRVVHKGQTAKELTEEIRKHKTTILNSVETAKELIQKFKDNKVTPAIAKAISDTVFDTHIKKKGFQEYTNYADTLVELNDISIYTYITATVNNYLKGEYTVTVNGKKKNGREVKSVLSKMNLEIKIMKTLQDEFIEYFL